MKSLAWLAFGACALACGGSAFTAAEPSAGGSASGADDNTAGVLSRAGRGSGGRPSEVGGTNSAGTTPVDPPLANCPENLPESGEACEGALSCSYGEDVRTQCRPRATCGSGVWAISEPDCPKLTACGALVKPGIVCESMAEACVTKDYEYCACQACTGDVCGTKSTWQCSGGSSSGGCPELAPNEGQSCSGNASCSYGGCGLGSGAPEPIQATCSDTWSWQPSLCAQ
jgi:hypothetical protein